MKKSLLYLFVIFLCLLPSLTLGVEGEIGVPKEVYDDICKDVIDESIGLTCDVKPSMLTWVDLNLDGIEEIIVDGNMISIWYVGSAGYTTFLFQKRGQEYILINDFFGWKVEVLSHKTNGYFDLSQENKDYYGPNDKQTGWTVNKRLYNFDETKGKYIEIGDNLPDNEANDFIYQYRKLEQKQKN